MKGEYGGRCCIEDMCGVDRCALGRCVCVFWLVEKGQGWKLEKRKRKDLEGMDGKNEWGDMGTGMEGVRGWDGYESGGRWRGW